MRTLTDLLKKSIRRLDQLMDTMAAVDPELLTQSPEPGAWTPLEILWHLYLSERNSLDFLLYAYGTEMEGGPLNLAARIRAGVVIAALKSPFKFTAPPSIDVRRVPPPAATSLADIRTLFEETHAEFLRLLQVAPARWSEQAIYRHPIVGYIGLRDALRFLHVHLERHAGQIGRALAQNARNNRREKASKRTSEQGE